MAGLTRCLVATLLLGGCSTAQELAVDVRTDLVPGTEFDAVRVRLDGADERRVEAGAQDDFATPRRVAEFASVASGRVTLEVALVRGATDVLSRRVVVRMEGSQIVLVVLTRDCRGVTCPGSGDDPSEMECFGGRCVDPECSDRDPERCGEPECEGDAECTTSTACVAPRCVAGACLELPRTSGEGACAAGEACVPGTGCVSLDTGDAGAPDAGAHDSGPHDSGPVPCTAETCVPGPCETATCVSGVCERASTCADGETCCAGDVCALDCSTSCGGRPAGSECRAARGPCDEPELCDGTSPTCPDDALRPAGTECRAALGECDLAEACSGESDACPIDAFEPIGTTCADGFCNGLGDCSSGCTPGAPCSTGNPCELGTTSCASGAPTCVGAGPAASVVCRASAGPCDLEERCTGSSTTCPADGFAGGTVECRPSAGPCDVVEYCAGSSASCPRTPSAPRASRAAWRAASATSRRAARARAPRAPRTASPRRRWCAGRAPARATSRSRAPDRPARARPTRSRRAASAARARARATWRSRATARAPPARPTSSPRAACAARARARATWRESCNGSGPHCPADQLAPSGTVCRAGTGYCNEAEACTGASAACPPDGFVWVDEYYCNDPVLTMPLASYDAAALAALGASTGISDGLEAHCLSRCDTVMSAGCCYVYYSPGTSPSATCYYSLGTAISPNPSTFVYRSAGVCQ
ncbi:MAG: hypothetical protein M5U28_45010 [Sandaracinaceae bacterium]|nr:hypothetical protein [Sandaracinaceae bacterium]